MTHTWDYPETVHYRAKEAFEGHHKVHLCTVWCMIDWEFREKTKEILNG